MTLVILYPFSVWYMWKFDSWAQILWAFDFDLKIECDRHARMKNRDAHHSCLRRHVSHYKVICDTSKCASSIRIHIRCVLLRTHLPLQANLRRTLWVVYLPLRANLRRATRALFINLVDTWGHCDTNKRRTLIRHDSYLMPPDISDCRLYPGAS
jgi:hypothetical protein